MDLKYKYAVEYRNSIKKLNHYLFTALVFEQVRLDICYNGEQNATGLIRNSGAIGTLGPPGRNSYIVDLSANNMRI